tara:strand:- start:588 stop:989 length:402 start_codon:yes stop_codon:yes gene_type:complete
VSAVVSPTQDKLHTLTVLFKKKNRLLKRKEFLRISYQGQRFFGRYLLIECCTSYHSGPRLGVTVTKHFGKAVARNYFKRCLREAFRSLLPTLPQYLDLQVKPRKNFSKASFEDIRKELLYFIQKWKMNEESGS